MQEHPLGVREYHFWVVPVKKAGVILADFRKKPKELLQGGTTKFLRTCDTATILEWCG